MNLPMIAALALAAGRVRASDVGPLVRALWLVRQ